MSSSDKATTLSPSKHTAILFQQTTEKCILTCCLLSYLCDYFWSQNSWLVDRGCRLGVVIYYCSFCKWERKSCFVRLTANPVMFYCSWVGICVICQVLSASGKDLKRYSRMENDGEWWQMWCSEWAAFIFIRFTF